MQWLSTLAVLAALAVGYWAWLQPLLARRPVLAGLLADFHAASGSLWSRAVAALRGWRSVLLARLYWIGGLALALHDAVIPALAGVDWTPLTTMALSFVAEPYRPLLLSLALAVTGALFEWLRRLAAGPVGEPSPAAELRAQADRGGL